MTAETLSRRGRAVQLHLAGWTVPKIADELGVTQRSVQRYLEQAGMRRGAPRLSEEEVAKAAALLEEGMSAAQAATVLGRSPKTLRRRFPDRKWTLSQAGRFGQMVRRLG